MQQKNTAEKINLTKLDKTLINLLQKGLPVCERPFAAVAEMINDICLFSPEQIDSSFEPLTEETVITRLNDLLERGILTRFGPMYDAACLGGAFTLAAIDVPDERFDEVTEIVNSFEQVAHNYERDHQLNMWFVVGTESQQEINQVITDIEKQTGLPVLNVPKLEEFYVGLYLSA